MSKPPVAAIVLPMQTLRELKMNAELMLADRVKIDIDARGEVAAVWYHEGDDHAWQRLRGPWSGREGEDR